MQGDPSQNVQPNLAQYLYLTPLCSIAKPSLPSDIAKNTCAHYGKKILICVTNSANNFFIWFLIFNFMILKTCKRPGKNESLKC